MGFAMGFVSFVSLVFQLTGEETRIYDVHWTKIGGHRVGPASGGWVVGDPMGLVTRDSRQPSCRRRPRRCWCAHRSGSVLKEGQCLRVDVRLFPPLGQFIVHVVAGQAHVVLGLAALVSFLPTRRISRVAPTDALRGRVF